MRHREFLSQLAQPADTKMVLWVLDGVGDLRSAEQPWTALAAASTPNLDALATRSALGRTIPVLPGVTPGSGPGHLALFGYDPTEPEVDIGRGVLEALGTGMEVRRGDVAARGNFATVDAEGELTDRRAGRPPTSESERLCEAMRRALADDDPVPGVEVILRHGENHRFVILLRPEADGPKLSAELVETDPQRIGVPPIEPAAEEGASDPEAAARTVEVLSRVLAVMKRAITDEPQANSLLLRGFSRLPDLPSMGELYGISCGAFAGYPLYRGVAFACGMEVIPCGKSPADTVAAAAERWDDFDYFFLHHKKPDMAGEDGDLAAKVAAIEAADAALPALLELEPDVVVVTGDHSTPAPMKAHSWHPVPLLLHGPRCYVDRTSAFDEDQAIAGHLGTFQAHQLIGLMLANAGRLAKLGA